MKLDALFFSAHPDDVELSCGGTAAKLVKSGKKVGITDLTQGELSTRGYTALRKKEAAEAAKVLGISIRTNLQIPDGNIQNSPVNRLRIIKIIRELRPEIIFFPHFHDRHPDHTAAHWLIKESAFYAGLSKIKTSLHNKQQKPHRPRRNYYYMQSYPFEPNIVTDISDVHDLKMKAIACYSSQFYNPASNEPDTFISSAHFLKFLEARARHFGFLAGVEHAEPFFAEETLKLDPLDLFKV